MDFSDTEEEARFRSNAREWIAKNAPSYLFETLSASGFGSTRTGEYDSLEEARKWQKKKSEAGWACIQWPTAYGGRDATPIQSVIWNQEEGVYSRLTSTFIIGQGMCAPTMMAYASESQKERYLPKLASGCLLYTSPSPRDRTRSRMPSSA